MLLLIIVVGMFAVAAVARILSWRRETRAVRAGSNDEHQAAESVSFARFALRAWFMQRAILVPVCVAVFFASRALGTVLGPSLEPGDLALVTPGAGYWLWPTLLVGASLADLAVDAWARASLGARHDAYRAYSRRRDGRPAPSGRVARWIVLIALVLGAAAIVLLSDWYVRFESHAVIRSPLFSVGTEELRPYAEVSGLRTARCVRHVPGGRCRRPYLEVRFRWGAPWDNTGWPRQVSHAHLVQLADTLGRTADARVKHHGALLIE